MRGAPLHLGFSKLQSQSIMSAETDLPRVRIQSSLEVGVLLRCYEQLQRAMTKTCLEGSQDLTFGSLPSHLVKRLGATFQSSVPKRVVYRFNAHRFRLSKLNLHWTRRLACNRDDTTDMRTFSSSTLGCCHRLRLVCKVTRLDETACLLLSRSPTLRRQTSVSSRARRNGCSQSSRFFFAASRV